MRELKLQRILRGPERGVVEELAGLLKEPVRVEDTSGKVVFGEREGGVRHPIRSGEEEVGAVFGGEDAASVARLVGFLHQREREKLALANETLGRYKELTLLYDVSDSLSRVLDVQQVATMVVEQAKRFLKATDVSLLLLDRRGDVLEPIATSSDAEPPAPRAANVGVSGRVLRTGQAEFVEDVSKDPDASSTAGSLMCAPLRTGETVFGILRLATTERARWTAGDLKLVTSLAANAASAISHAMLHQEQLRQQALRSQVERFVSPALAELVPEDTHRRGDPLAVLFCDVGLLSRSMSASVPPEEVAERLMQATASALSALLDRGAMVNTTQAEMLVAIFPHPDGLAAGAALAVDAARAMIRGHAGLPCPGVGLASAVPDDATTFLAGVGVAAALQSSAEGRVLVDAALAAALPVGTCTPAEPIELSGREVEVYEVAA